MRTETGHTPKEYAVDIALTWLRAAYQERTLNGFDNMPPALKREVKKQVAKLHNRLLNQSGLDGVPLDEEVSK